MSFKYFKIFTKNSSARNKRVFNYLTIFDTTIKNPYFVNFDKFTFLKEAMTPAGEALIPQGLWEFKISFEIEPRPNPLIQNQTNSCVISWDYNLELTLNGEIVNDRPAMYSSGDARHTATFTVIVPVLQNINLLGVKLTMSGRWHGLKIGVQNYIPLDDNQEIFLANLYLEGKKIHHYDLSTLNSAEKTELEALSTKLIESNVENKKSVKNRIKATNEKELNQSIVEATEIENKN